MEKISLKNFSFLGLTLMGVSAITAAMTPSKEKSETAVRDRIPNNGHAVQSTVGGVQSPLVPVTVSSQVGGNRSYTATGLPGDQDDGLSATSDDVADDTATSERSWSTALATTDVARENQDVVHDD
jgi:hypothetical protein